MAQCTEQFDECDALPLSGETWSVCLPFAGRIWADGNGVHGVKGTNLPPDGVYGKVVIANGCIIGVEEEDVPLYTGSPCAPLPGDCGSGGTTGGGTSGSGTGSGSGSGGCICDLTPSSASGNLFATDAAGRPLVRCYVQAGSGITVTGNGTLANPYIVSAGSASGGSGVSVSPIYIRSGNEAITVTGSGSRTDPFVISHKMGESATINGMTFDNYGHLTGVSAVSSGGNKGVTAVIGQNGIEAATDNNTGIVTIGLSANPNNLIGAYTFGGYNVSVDNWGRIYGIDRAIDLGASHVVTCGDTKLTINALGSITAVEGGSSGGGGDTTPEPTPTPTPTPSGGGGGGCVVMYEYFFNRLGDRFSPSFFFNFTWPSDSGAYAVVENNLHSGDYDGAIPITLDIDGTPMTGDEGVPYTWPATIAAGQHRLTVYHAGRAQEGRIKIVLFPMTMATRVSEP